MDHPPRLLFIAREFMQGGAASMAARMARRLIPSYDIDFLLTGPLEARMAAALPPRARLFRLDPWSLDGSGERWGGRDPLGALELFLRRRRVPVLERRYHAVLATSVFPDWRACLAVSLARSPRKLLFLVDESLRGYAGMAPREKAAVDACLFAADLVVPVSAKLKRTLEKDCPPLARRPWKALPPPVEAGDPPGDPDPLLEAFPRDLPLVLTLARLVPDKGIRESLLVHDRLRREGLDFRWVVLGDGEDAHLLKSEIARLGLQDRFFLLGHREKVYGWLEACDLFALFSRSEGGPTVVREALRAGRPVVIAQMNGDDEMVEEGVTGLILPQDPEALAAGLGRLLRDKALRERMRAHLGSAPRVGDAEVETRALTALLEDRAPEPEGPLVSILIPTYGQAEVLDRAVASALMQTHPRLEVVVMDDASPDATPERVRKWLADPRFRHVRNPENLGRAANYRKGLVECARGDWALMLDGDDHLEDPDFIARALAALERHRGRPVRFVQAGHRVRQRDGGAPDVDILPPIEGDEALLSGTDYLRLVFRTGFFTHLGILFDRRAAVQAGVYTAPIRSTDMDSFLRLALEGEVLLLKTLAGCWVQHGGNASSHLPFDEIGENAGLFRRVARMAVDKGLAGKELLGGDLTRYEAQTLAYLFHRSLLQVGGRRFPWLRAVSVALAVNPGLLIHLRFAASYLRLARRAVKYRLFPWTRPRRGLE